MIKRGKKGQVTLFIIIAIAVVAVVALTIVFWPRITGIFMSQQEAEAFLATQSESVRDAVYDCTESVSKEIFETIGLQAGYYNWDHLYAIEYAGPKIVVMYKDENAVRMNKLPSIEMIAQEYQRALQDYGYDQIDSCLNNFAGFKRKMNVEPGQKTITAQISDDDILIDIDWPITISKSGIRGDASQTLNQRDVLLLIPLGKVWRVANDIVNSEVEQEDFVNQIEEYIQSHDFLLKYISIGMHYPTSEQSIYLLKTIPHRLGEEEFLFYFAVDRT